MVIWPVFSSTKSHEPPSSPTAGIYCEFGLNMVSQAHGARQISVVRRELEREAPLSWKVQSTS